MIKIDPIRPMQVAIQQASLAGKMGEVPVGAVMLNHHGHIIAKAHNLTRQACNPLYHAEILAIQAACHLLKTERLVDCDLYVTLEPCAMCAAAISHARIRRLYFASYDVKGGAVEHGPRWYEQKTCLHRPEIIGGILEIQAQTLLKDFFNQLRK